MGWSNPDVPWKELHQRLTDRPGTDRPGTGRADEVPAFANGGDSPAWSRKRAPYEAPTVPAARAGRGRVPYAELHCHSNFSFLDGASHPEELVEEAARLELDALALTDHDGMYGVVRFAEAASAVGMPTIFGAELSLGLTKPQNGVADPEGRHLLVLARDPQGYGRLCRAISAAQLAGREKGKPVFSLSALAEASGGHWLVLTGCRKGTVPSALMTDGPAAATRQLADLVIAFGRDNVAVELWDHGDPLDSARNDALVDIALRQQVEVVATNNVHYSVPSRRALATALAAVRARRSLDEIDGWLPPSGAAHLRSGLEQARRFARYPGVVERAAALARDCAFDLRLVAPNLPDHPVPEGHTEMSWLRVLTERGAAKRYGPRTAERVPGAYAQIDHELALIEQLDFPGYFLIVHDIVEFCRTADIYCQGRGSAANSAVCYALGITAADAVSLGLLFERFLSPERDGPPDIDVDIESDRREEAIQYVYERYGRQNAAQVANVITYRPKSAVRDMGKALGYSMGQLDAWSKQVDGWGPMSATVAAVDGDGRGGGEVTIPAPVLELASAVEHFPRHLGIHSGGMVICDRPVSEVVPVEWGRMEGRTVLQWDKDDCAAAGLVKFDLLGLGMLSALHYAVDLIRDAYGVEIDLAMLPQDDAVYEMLCKADSVGVFQVESRAQMATLPRLKPRTFYDLVVEVALIRPGPIQGGSVHPYIRRRNGREAVTYLHPLLERSLKKTLGVPLFQEQLMQMAIDVAGFTAGEADQLRQAMGSKRSKDRMERLKARLYEGMAERGITGDVADQIYDKLAAFANFGFPESHSVSFAYLVYSSSWLKLHYPAAFCAALLNAQPMGFYSPQSLVADAKRHGVTVLPPDVNASSWDATLEPLGALREVGVGSASEQPTRERSGGSAERAGNHETVGVGSASEQPTRERSGGSAERAINTAVRLGISSVRSIGTDVAKKVAAGRPYASMEEVVRAAALTEPQVEALATAGAFASLGIDRREALWAAGAVSQSKADRLPGVVVGAEAPALPGMDPMEETIADLWSTSVTTSRYPTEFVRERLDELGAVAASGLHGIPHGERVLVGGVVTHRQRPATAQGTIFLNLEDETGLINIVCSKGAWAHYRRAARSAPALLIRGKLEKIDGVINVIADKITELSLTSGSLPRSRDFR